eukprot:9490383-Pyramimonas_sp.AAC.2
MPPSGARRRLRDGRKRRRSSGRRRSTMRDGRLEEGGGEEEQTEMEMNARVGELANDLAVIVIGAALLAPHAALGVAEVRAQGVGQAAAHRRDGADRVVIPEDAGRRWFALAGATDRRGWGRRGWRADRGLDNELLGLVLRPRILAALRLRRRRRGGSGQRRGRRSELAILIGHRALHLPQGWEAAHLRPHCHAHRRCK